MVNIPGYIVDNIVYESPRHLVCRGKRETDQSPVILKILKKEHPTAEELRRFQSEFDVIQRFNIDGIIKAYDLGRKKNHYTMVIEDFNGQSLTSLLESAGGKFSIKKTLVFGIKIAGILDEIHKKNVMHKDINLSNILWDPKNDQLKIIDFDIATVLTRETPEILHPNILEGTLTHISPEQTGRMNRPIDYRTDFYSFGVTLYKMLTGKLPFKSDDMMEMVHFHIASKPAPPNHRNPEIPQILSDIIMKMMAKMAEDRYQSAYGIKADLQRCLDEFTAKGEIAEFPLAEQDAIKKFQIPEKLYGRDKEIKALLDTFERVSHFAKKQDETIPKSSFEMILVSGYSGIGKTALVNEIHKPIVREKGYFVSGKYDQFKKDIPYSAILQAFQKLIIQLLMEGKEEISKWKDRLLQVLAPNAQILIDVIPEVELIVGEQPPVQELPPAETQNRFMRVIQQFIKAFWANERPLVVFMDDLQWMDSASLALLKALSEDPEIKYFLCIGAYRSNELRKGHPSMMTLDEMRNAGTSINTITLAPLKLEDVTHLISDTLRTKPNECNSLAQLVFQKTRGNPFFLKQFLSTLYEEKLIDFDEDARRWDWDVTEISGKNITDNVVELMAKKINKFPKKNREVLSTASCVGLKFHTDNLALVLEKPEEEIVETLQPVLNEGMIARAGEGFRFVHDRVHEAAYSLLSEKRRKEIHYRIGIVTLEAWDEVTIKERVFSLVNQLNRASDLLSQDEKKRVLELNVEAGEKALAAVAYDAAIDFFKQAEALLPPDAWKTDYAFTLSLYTKWSEAEYMARNNEETERLFDTVLTNAKTLMDKMKVFTLQIEHYTVQLRFDDAIRVGREVLAQLDVVLPEKVDGPVIMREIEKINKLLGDRDIQDLINLPKCDKPEVLSAMNLLLQIFAPTFLSGSGLTPIVITTLVELSLKYGNSPFSTLGYSTYAFVILVTILGDHRRAYEFGKLAVALVDEFGIKMLQGIVYVQYGAGVAHWREPLGVSQSYLLASLQHCHNSGEHLYQGYGYCQYLTFHFLTGKDLNVLNELFTRYTPAVQRLKQIGSWLFFGCMKQAVLNLSGNSEHTYILKGDAFDEVVNFPALENSKNFTDMAHCLAIKIMMMYLFGEYADGFHLAEKYEKHIPEVASEQSAVMYYFFQALLAAALYHSPDSGSDEKSMYLDKLMAYREKFKAWGELNPHAYQHKYLLLSAEIHRINGNITEAMNEYDRAVQIAGDNEIILEEAVANECAGRFYLSLKNEKIASIYIRSAYYLYQVWGAVSKTTQLNDKYPLLLSDASTALSHNLTFVSNVTMKEATDKSGTTTGLTSQLDFNTILKSSQAISSEISFALLLEKMMRIVIENAGAEKGFLILEKDGKQVIEAEGRVDEKEVKVLQSIPIESVCGDSENPRIPNRIVNYVISTKQNVILDDAAVKGNFTNVPYIKKRKPKSVLCMPFIHQGKLNGTLYMENNLTTGAFTKDRIEILKMLSSQIAISIENAKVYREIDELNKSLEQKVAARTRELSEKNSQIMSSIYYAQRIQLSILPSREKIENYLPQHFVYWSPRDIVGGDFYYLEKVDDDFILAVIDCTGHGVPGAFMTMTANSILNHIVKDICSDDPAKILNELNKIVRKTLGQDNVHSLSDDGMDVGLCLYKPREKCLIFAGAKIPLYYIKDGKLHQIKGDRRSIGYKRSAPNFQYNNHRIDVDGSEVFYLSSDGYSDQNGGNEDRSFGRKRYKAMLLEHYKLPLPEQKKIFKDCLKTYKKDEAQRDDITVIGVKFQLGK